MSRDDGSRRLRIDGPLGFGTVGAELSRLDDLLSAGAETIVVELDGVREFDSAGVALLLEWRRRAARRGVRLELHNLPDGLREIARISDADGFLTAG